MDNNQVKVEYTLTTTEMHVECLTLKMEEFTLLRNVGTCLPFDMA